MPQHIDYDKENKRRVWWLNKTGGSVAEGLTVRDYFAAKAVEGVCALMLKEIRYNHDLLAADAYALADAMMKERAK